MKNSTGKILKSFTIIELVTVMILSGIVVSMGYLAYGIINKQLIYYRASSKKTEDLSGFSRIIKSDISKSEKVIRKGYGFDCIQLDKTVQYNVQYDYIIRSTTLQSDTFNIITLSTTYLDLEESKVYSNEEIKTLSFITEFKKEQLELVITTNQL